VLRQIEANHQPLAGKAAREGAFRGFLFFLTRLVFTGGESSEQQRTGNQGKGRPH
jgi:hypothetical protein